MKVTLTYSEETLSEDRTKINKRTKKITFDEDAIRIDLSDKSIGHIDLTPLSSCSDLQSLTLQKNRIKKIDLTPLSSCSDLKALHLQKNRIETIDLSPLRSCSKLWYLDLGLNKLSTIDLSPFLGSQYLRRLLLNRNLFQSIDLAPLASCSNLVVLDLDDNSLESVDITALAWKYKENEALEIFHADAISTPWLDPTVCGPGLKYTETYSRPSGIYPWPFLHRAAKRFKKYRRVQHNILDAMGLREYGFINRNPVKLFLSIPPSTPIEEAREIVIHFLVEAIVKAVDIGKATTGLDLETIAQRHDEIADRYDRIAQLRASEMEKVAVRIYQESYQTKIDLSELYLTAHGYAVLKSYSIGTTPALETFNNLVDEFTKIGFTLKKSKRITPGVKMSKWLRKYILTGGRSW